MNVVIAGSSGLIGSALTGQLVESGARVTHLVRPGKVLGPDEVRWDPTAGILDPSALEGAQAVVNLAGRPIEPRRWSDDYRADILNSRVRATSLLAKTMAALGEPPAVLVNASASGFYGDRGDEQLTEDSAPGSGFLAGVCQQWESATQPASAAGIRVVMVRTGLVLSPQGGAMGRMLPLFKLGVGGRIGPGTQWWSWIALEDEVGAIRHALDQATVRGPVNLTAPQPVTNAEFTTTLAQAVGKPAGLAVPRFALRAAMGEFADEGLLASQRILPARLEETGYQFRQPALAGAFERLLAKT